CAPRVVRLHSHDLPPHRPRPSSGTGAPQAPRGAGPDPAGGGGPARLVASHRLPPRNQPDPPEARRHRRHPRPLRVPSPDRDALITLARQAGQRGWWTAYQDVFAGSYVALEDEASHIRTWDPQLVHGLLQTEDYSRAVITAGRLLPAQEDIERRISARKIRQSLLDRPAAPRLQ